MPDPWACWLTTPPRAAWLLVLLSVLNGQSVPGQFSFLVSLAFCLNYVLGTGFLTLPWAFAQVGTSFGRPRPP